MWLCDYAILLSLQRWFQWTQWSQWSQCIDLSAFRCASLHGIHKQWLHHIVHLFGHQIWNVALIHTISCTCAWLYNVDWSGKDNYGESAAIWGENWLLRSRFCDLKVWTRQHEGTMACTMSCTQTIHGAGCVTRIHAGWLYTVRSVCLKIVFPFVQQKTCVFPLFWFFFSLSFW